MSSNHLAKTERIFRKAVQIVDPAERETYLHEACQGDTQLQQDVKSLLTADDSAGQFLEGSPINCEVTLDAGPLAEGPGTLIGPYKILEKIGEGGMAVVYMAQQEQPLRRRVALKLIKLGMDTREVIARFEAERQALALMDHSNIAKVFDAGATETGRPFFVMELVRGASITEFCDKNHLNTRERLELFISVCQAVHHAHQKGIIHRDIKPSNIMVTLHDGEPIVKVIDFGIAKAVNQQLTEKTVFTRYAQLIGTPEYMSPEQAEMSGLDVDTRTDVFSLGVLLYELLTGATPFDSEFLLSKGYGELQRIIREEEPVRPSTKISTLGETATDIAKHRRTSPELLCKLMRTDLDWIVMKTLEKNRKRRYESVSEFAADIRRHLDHELVVAGRPSAIYKTQKFVKRNKALCISVATIAVILIFAAIFSTRQAWIAHKARRAESSARASAEQERDQTKQAERKAQQEKRVAQQNAYASKMQLARMDWENGNINRVQETLAKTEDYPNHGFEWYYWQRMCHLDLMTLRAHDGPVYAAVYSPDGMTIASCSGNKVHIWDARTGTEITTYEGHKTPIYALAYSPDGQWIVTGSGDDTARIWDTKTGKPLKLLQGHTGDILCVDISSDGQWIATGSKDQTIRVWDAETGNIKSRLRHRCLVGLTGVAFSPDGQHLASSGLSNNDAEGDTAMIWDLSSNKNTIELIEQPYLPLHVEYLPDGQRLVHAGFDGRVVIRNSTDGRLIRTYEGHKNNVNFTSTSPDGKRIVSGSVAGTMRIWDIDSGYDLMILKGHTGSVSHAEFSPNGERIVSSSEDGTIKIWNALDDPSLLILQHAPIAPAKYAPIVTAIDFSPNNRWLAAGDWGRKVRIWDVVHGKLVQTFSGHNGRILSVSFSSDGKRIATSGNDGTIKVWDPSSGRVLLIVDEFAESGHLVVYTDDQRLVSGGSDGIIRIWDGETGQLTLTIPGHSNKINDIAVSPDGRTIGSIYEDGTIKLSDSATGHEIYARKAYDRDGRSIAFSPDGEHFASGGSDSTILKVSRVASGQELFRIEGKFRQGIAYSPDGKRLAYGGGLRGELHIIDAMSGEEFLVMQRRGVFINDVAFSSDGKRIASCGFNRKVIVWQIASEHEVKAWRKEQLAADQEQTKSKTLRQTEADQQPLARLSDAGAIKSWLILGPMPPDKDTGSIFEKPLIPNEANLCPSVGDISLVSNSEYVWNTYHFDDAVIDFTRYIKRNSGDKVSYAVCYVKMNDAQEGVLLRFDCNTKGAKIYLNSQRICTSSRFQRNIENVAELTLKSGINVVVLETLYDIDRGQASLWFVDGDGNQLEGLSVTLDPNESVKN